MALQPVTSSLCPMVIKSVITVSSGKAAHESQKAPWCRTTSPGNCAICWQLSEPPVTLVAGYSIFQPLVSSHGTELNIYFSIEDFIKNVFKNGVFEYFEEMLIRLEHFVLGIQTDMNPFMLLLNCFEK